MLEPPTTLPLPRPTTQLCAVLLHPAAHTRSPAMHNAAFAALGLDAIYLAFDVPPDALANALAGARALGVRQLAISIPHKQAVGGYCDELDETARSIGAVNTITREGDRLIGANTDWMGAVRALEREGPIAGTQAVVLGAGGTARAVTYGLLRGGARVTVLNRTRNKAEALAKELGAQASGSLEDLSDLDHDVLVNTTSVGLRENESPVPASALRKGSRVLDAVYDPAETTLLRYARDAGATPIGGKWMLALQAVEQIRLWSGKTPPCELLARAFDLAT